VEALEDQNKKGRCTMNHELVKAYTAALDAADLEGMLKLFAPGATVHSPLYGSVVATEFYKEMFAKSGGSKGELLGVLGKGESVSGRPLIAFWFRWDWVLASGTHAPLEIVDLCELDSEGRITRLNIIYDTATVRPLLEDEVDTMFGDRR
jgi:hypothetical protein